MSEGLRYHTTLALLLQPIVADRRSRGQCLFGVAWLELLHRVRVMAPHAREAIGLQLEAHGERIELSL